MENKIKENWEKVKKYIKEEFNLNPEIHSILFLIGIQELNYGFKQLDKDTKVKVINFASIFVLKYLEEKDREKIKQNFHNLSKTDETDYEEELYKLAIVRYFKDINVI